MALVRFGSVVQAASGRLGAVCFSRQGGSPIVRTEPIVKPHQSAAVLANQAAFAQARLLWLDLGDGPRMMWGQAAVQFPTVNRLGLKRQLSGFALFCACAVRGLNSWVGVSYNPIPGGYQTPGLPCSVEIWPGGPAEVFTDADYDSYRPYITVRAQRFCSSSNGKPGRLWRVVGRARWSKVSINVWNPDRPPPLSPKAPGLVTFGVPGRLEWYLVEVEQWAHGYFPTFISRHLVQIPNVGDELTYNGDFQVGGTPPAGWAVVGTGALTQSVTTPYGDAFSGRWQVAAAEPETNFQTDWTYRFALVSGQGYTFRCAYKVVSGNISTVAIYYGGVGDQVLSGPLAVVDGLWHRLEIPFVSTWTSSDLRLAVRSAAGIAGDVYLDNVSIRKDVYA